MDLVVEIKAEYRKSSYACRREILNIENIFRDKLVNNKEIKCAICGKLLSNNFRIACRVYEGSKKVLLHPVHITCIEDYTSLEKIISSNTNYKDISHNDLIDSIGIVETLHGMDRNGELQDLNESKSTCFTNDMPNPNIKGEPFYTMVEIKEDKLTGNIESYKVDNKLFPVLYVSKKIAKKAKEIKDSSFKNDYYVAGILKSQLNGMLEGFKGKFLVVMAFEGKKAISIPLTAKELDKVLKPNEWLSKVIEESQ